MRFLRAFFFVALLTFPVFAQAEESLVTLKGNFDFDNPAERLITYRFFDNGAKLWMLGANTIQVWDVANKKVISSARHGIEDLTGYTFGGLSPDGSKLFFVRHKYIVDDGIIRSAYVFDLNTLKKIRSFDEKLRAGYWNKDGRIFVTVANGIKPDPKKAVKNYAVSFWDGETLEPRKTITVPDLDWWYLSPDGEQFFTTSVPTKKWLGTIPYDNGMANVITVWNVEKGQVEKNLSVGGEDYAVLTWKLMPSPSGRYIAMVSKHKSDEEEHKILFWELNGSDSPKYSIKASPKLSDSNIRYSPDEQFFAVDSGKNIQVYQSETGQKKGEILNTNLPDYWLSGNQILFTTFAKKMHAFSIATGNQLYENPLIYDTYDRSTDATTDVNGNTVYNYEKEVTDQTIVVPNPNGKIYLTYSNQYVRLYQADTGKLIETIVRPPLSVVKQKRSVREKRYVNKAGWTEDGKTLYIINGDNTAMSLWDFKNS